MGGAAEVSVPQQSTEKGLSLGTFMVPKGDGHTLPCCVAVGSLMPQGWQYHVVGLDWTYQQEQSIPENWRFRSPVESSRTVSPGSGLCPDKEFTWGPSTALWLQDQHIPERPVSPHSAHVL